MDEHRVRTPVGTIDPPTDPIGPPARPVLTHLARLTSPLGVWEHARYRQPRPEHGYCTDDNARALIVACRAGRDRHAQRIGATTFRFLLDARAGDGHVRNRRMADGRWLEEPLSDDAVGRTFWAFGTAARRGTTAGLRREASAAFTGLPPLDTPFLRPQATAILGAVELLDVEPTNRFAWRLVASGAARIAAAAVHRDPWLEPLLTYDDARMPEALLAAGVLLRDHDLVDLGLSTLRWLVDQQTHHGRFTFTPAGGARPSDPRPAFDQQPIEACAMAEACARARAITGAPSWARRTHFAAAWLQGHNDNGAVLYDPVSGATADGLTRDGINENRGAESTIAGLATLQAARRTPTRMTSPADSGR